MYYGPYDLTRDNLQQQPDGNYPATRWTAVLVSPGSEQGREMPDFTMGHCTVGIFTTHSFPALVDPDALERLYMTC